MSDNTQSGPVMAGSTDASDQDKLAGLIDQVEQDNSGEGARAKDTQLRARMDEANVDAEDGDALAE